MYQDQSRTPWARGTQFLLAANGQVLQLPGIQLNITAFVVAERKRKKGVPRYDIQFNFQAPCCPIQTVTVLRARAGKNITVFSSSQMGKFDFAISFLSRPLVSRDPVRIGILANVICLADPSPLTLFG